MRALLIRNPERQSGLPVTVGIGGRGCDSATKTDMVGLTVNI